MSENKFAIIGGSLWANRGAEAMIAASMARVRDLVPDARFLLLSYHAEKDRQLSAGTGLEVDTARPIVLLLVHFPFAFICWMFRKIGIRLPDAALPGAVRRLRACRALLDISGISFHDGRLGVVAYNVFCIWPAMLLGVPVLHLSQAKGPFNHLLNRVPARLFLSACHHSYARGRITADYVSQLGLPPERWSVAADVAFSFEDGDSFTRENDDKVAELIEKLQALKSSGTRIVALSPSSLVLGKTGEAGIPYVALLARAAAHLQQHGYHILVIPNATKAGEDVKRNNDFVVIEQLRREVENGAADPAGVSWVQFDLNTDSIRKLIGECDLLVTSRFHAMVAGLSLCVPTLVVGWSHKYEEVLELFGCQDDAIDFAELDSQFLPEIDAMLGHLDERRERIAKALPDVVASSRSQFEPVVGLAR